MDTKPISTQDNEVPVMISLKLEFEQGKLILHIMPTYHVSIIHYIQCVPEKKETHKPSYFFLKAISIRIVTTFILSSFF